MTFLLAYWRVIALVVALGAAAAFGAYRMHVHDQIAYDALQSEFDTFKGGVAALGRAAEERAKATDAANLKRKQDADAENGKTKRDLDGLYVAYQRLRDSRKGSGSGVLPAAPSTPSGPPVLAFDRAALDRGLEEADGILQGGAATILRRGDEAIKDLNTARAWATKP